MDRNVRVADGSEVDGDKPVCQYLSGTERLNCTSSYASFGRLLLESTRTTLTATRVRSMMQHGYAFGCEAGPGAIETCANLVQWGCVRTAV